MSWRCCSTSPADLLELLQLCFCFCALQCLLISDMLLQSELAVLSEDLQCCLESMTTLCFLLHRHPARPAAPDLCRQAAGGRPHAGGLQHPEGVHAAPGAAPAWRHAGELLVVACNRLAIGQPSGTSADTADTAMPQSCGQPRPQQLTNMLLAPFSHRSL